ncbi:MAG TPA: hypothetical protein VG722_10340, partial [Tepidisphaeraceae bacterium]|nr:hypothetical protein [Tepidisphaeraceae bacterium]
LAEAHRQWNLRHAAPLPRFKEYSNSRQPNRRLRIGYVSPDFRQHVVGRFIAPLFAHHNHEAFEIFAYTSVSHPDSLTARLKSCTDTWKNVLVLSDEQLAEQIHADEIDVLVDLTMHMAGSRLLTFARKPAPVQITYLAYCSTTGLDAMDFRFTDRQLDPTDDTDIYSELSVYLQRYWCYEAPEPSPPVAALPMISGGSATFGCLNNFCKVSQIAFELWARILQTVHNSRLILHAHPGAHRQEALDRFNALGIAPDRIQFVDFAPMAEYLRLYQKIDIALDPFPYAGGTTTCDALWMGVPVISLSGQTAVSRSGASILSQVGMSELVADSQDQYVAIAAALANEPSRLQALRLSLRDRMLNSPLMNGRAFAADVETAYRRLWIKWCSEKS